MTEYYIDPEDIITDFLRTNLIDPQAKAEATNTENSTASASQTTITLDSIPSGTASCITSLSIGGTAKVKWEDYYWDYQNQTITLFTALTGGEAIAVTYKYGTTNWIYSDQPDEKLSTSSFPRISVFTVSGSGRRLGQYNAPVESSPVLQIDVWVKNGQVFTIGGRKYSNNYLSRYLGYQITKAFEQSEDDLFPTLYNYIPIGTPRTAPYSEEYQAYHTVVEVQIKGLRIGRIEVA